MIGCCVPWIVLGGVLVLRAVAAADVPADETKPQMHPMVPHFQAFLAAGGVRRYVFDLIDVLAALSHFPVPRMYARPIRP